MLYYNFRDSWSSDKDVVDEQKFEELKSQIEKSFEDRASREKTYAKDYKKPKNREDTRIKQLSFFDPNMDSFKSLLTKGIPYSVVKNIVNYREKVGPFRSKEDVLKLYGVDEALFEKMVPYIVLSQEYEEKKEESRVKITESKTIEVISLNTASAMELESIRGIGPSYAKRIIAYRDKLGGYLDIAQLEEVYGLEEDLINKVAEFLKIDKSLINKIKVNEVSYEELYQHPYLSYKEAKAIVNYREQHGSFSKTEDLEKLHIFRGKNISRILPYLDLN